MSAAAVKIAAYHNFFSTDVVRFATRHKLASKRAVVGHKLELEVLKNACEDSAEGIDILIMEEVGEHYTVDEAARILELSPACVRQLLRAGELEGERREERIKGVLGPWRIPKHTVLTLRKEKPDVLQAKRRNACDATATTAKQLPGETATDAAASKALLGATSSDTPSESSELLSESVREVREKAEALREELELLEGRLELVEITESALREELRREKERADRERERADGLRAKLEVEQTRRSEQPQEL